jgi:hypothetical protein
MQLALFPTYPRLEALVPTPEVIYDLSEDWKLFDYPSEDLDTMGQPAEQADILTYLKSVIDAVMGALKVPHFVGQDVFVYYTKHDHKEAKKGAKPAPKQIQLAPDLFIVTPVVVYDRTSFIKENELALLGAEAGNMRMIAVEVLSEANYAKKDDQQNRLAFYDGIGVEEYIVIHTKPYLSLEVFWRIGGELIRTLFYHNYKIEMLNITFEIVVEAGKKRKLFLRASDGSRFESYGTEREIRFDAEQKLADIRTKLTEYTEELLAEQEARTEAEKRAEEELQARTEAEKRAEEESQARTEAEKRAKKEANARIKAEEEAQRLAFELAELRHLLKVQKEYES